MSINPTNMASIKLVRSKLIEALKILEKTFDKKNKHYENMISLTAEIVDLFKEKNIFDGVNIKENMISSAILILGLLDKMFSGEMNDDLRLVVEKINFVSTLEKSKACLAKS